MSNMPTPTTSARSCVTCRRRKVRCDKLSAGCSNCTRGGIPCVYPSTNRPPRWVRRLGYANNATAPDTPAAYDASSDVIKLVDKLRSLEALVQVLRGQLEQAQAASSPESHVDNQHQDSQHQDILAPNVAAESLQQDLGRLVLQDASNSHYVSSSFWSRINDEVCILKYAAT